MVMSLLNVLRSDLQVTFCNRLKVYCLEVLNVLKRIYINVKSRKVSFTLKSVKSLAPYWSYSVKDLNFSFGFYIYRDIYIYIYRGM